MNEIQILHTNGKTKNYRAPASWEELSAANLKVWAAICTKAIALDEAKRQLVQQFYRIPRRDFVHLKAAQVWQIADTLNFLFEKNRLCKWLMKSVRSGWNRYHGPEDFLANLTIAEYRFTELYYQAYIRTQRKEWLLLLMATLYRKKRKEKIKDDIRESLSAYGVAQRARRFESLSASCLQACLLNYEGCRNHLIRTYAPVFKPTNPKEQSAEIFDLEVLIEAFAGDKFGCFRETEKTNLHRFFRYLVRAMEKVV